ncbi:uncharacterized protein TRAVEDRAFT_53394 [Trametes versicolor FP-101664 SS1]|uniref:uncharacterized protein n=1 Tax=Trametes versicolor (strain FP-101664) TaxID=717944 RepID=UPI00046239AF|nr:uncharacterized protein TRAVEDRAFT_53394 [Trametes versicolor FP-101664 SS1]EIW52972.1 hypothetical protein TRAVEDRAFT_53394 [Trametes versicolor FP-101664 SS1]
MDSVLAIMLPTAFFAALDRGASADGSRDAFVSDTMRDSLLKMSRGVSVMLLLIYVASRIYRHNPPSFQRPKEPSIPASGLPATDAPSSAPPSTTGARPGPLLRGSASRNSGGLGLVGKRENDSEERLLHPIVCATLICVSTAVMGVTAEFLVQSIDPIRERFDIQAEWFGLILIPLVSFAPEAVVVVWYFAAPSLKWLVARLGCNTCAAHEKKSHTPSLLAHGRPIDLSIQFTLWWMPLLVLFAWWTGKPFHLLFDYFEVALLLGSCFLVNYVTADGKTNFAEGVTLITFYAMIATATWFYPGQPQVGFLLSCPGSVAEAVASGVGNVLAMSL